MCLGWVCAKSVEAEDAASDEAMEYALGVCGGGWDVEV